VARHGDSDEFHRDAVLLGVLLRVDVLQRRKDERWRLIEVKSTTDVKDHHLEDVAIQHLVTRSGVDLAASCLAHVSRDYVCAALNQAIADHSPKTVSGYTFGAYAFTAKHS
jgi:hypothetical protein